MRIVLTDISKNFAEKRIFKNINLALESGQSVAITGPNGSGKTTLVRIICGLIRPSMGRVEYFLEERKINLENVYRYLGLVGPYLELYEELSALENLLFFGKLRRIPDLKERIHSLMDQFKLSGREEDDVKTYSSGMRQRLKYVFALLSQPEILILDEPTANLDSEGIERVYEIMNEQKKNKILILATNDHDDLIFGDSHIAINA
jgi:heme exporter protein A